MFGRHSWTPAAIIVTQPKQSCTNIRITARRSLQRTLTSPASQATPITEF